MWTKKGTAGLSSGIHVSRSVDCRLQQTTIMAFRIIRHELLHELLDNCKNKGGETTVQHQQDLGPAEKGLYTFLCDDGHLPTN